MRSTRRAFASSLGCSGRSSTASKDGGVRNESRSVLEKHARNLLSASAKDTAIIDGNKKPEWWTDELLQAIWDNPNLDIVGWKPALEAAAEAEGEGDAPRTPARYKGSRLADAFFKRYRKQLLLGSEVLEMDRSQYFWAQWKGLTPETYEAAMGPGADIKLPLHPPAPPETPEKFEAGTANTKTWMVKRWRP